MTSCCPTPSATTRKSSASGYARMRTYRFVCPRLHHPAVAMAHVARVHACARVLVRNAHSH